MITLYVKNANNEDLGVINVYEKDFITLATSGNLEQKEIDQALKDRGYQVLFASFEEANKWVDEEI